MNEFTVNALKCPNPSCSAGPWDSWKALLVHINHKFSQCKDFRYTSPDPVALQDYFCPPITLEEAPLYSATPIPDLPLNPGTPQFIDSHPTASRAYGKARNTLEKMDSDQYAHRRVHNAFYPFSDRSEWELARFLCQSSLKQGEIDAFLKLPWIVARKLSFASYHVLRSFIEALPHTPEWRTTEIIVDGYPTTKPLTLLYRDGLECAEFLAGNPVFGPSILLQPQRVYTNREKSSREYSEFMTADNAWEYQNQLPEGGTLVGIVGASDKTAVTMGTGGLQMHPTFITLANFTSEVRMKESNRAWMCVAFMPIPHFEVHPDYQSILAARVWHKCVDIFSSRLKQAARVGYYMPDPNGVLRQAFTPLVGWIADLPEQQLIAATAASASPTSTATTKDFGDPFPHLPRRGADTLRQIYQLALTVDPWDLSKFQVAAKLLHLSGVHLPFWRDWSQADPSKFLNPEILHSGHKFFFDHVLAWCKEALGPPELDARYMSLHTRIGTRHFPEGICHVKQMTGREHREIQRTIVAVIAGACSGGFVRAVRAIVDFIYQMQAPVFTNSTINALVESLKEFHDEKHHVLEAGARRGEKTTIEHFNIPKLEVLQATAQAIRGNGNLMQWSADATERLLQTNCKHTFRQGSNHRGFDEQCVRMLDRAEKIHQFDLFTALRSRGLELTNHAHPNAQGPDSHPLYTWLSRVAPGDKMVGVPRPVCNLFLKGSLGSDTSSLAAYHLNGSPDIPIISINDAASLFGLQDLRPALGDYHRGLSYVQRNGRRVSDNHTTLPFSHIRVWLKFKIQQHSVHNPNSVIPSRTVQALPPSSYNKHGHCDTVLINSIDGNTDSLAQIRIIFQPIFPGVPRKRNSSPASPTLLYAQTFKYAGRRDQDGTLLEEPNVDMYLLQRHCRSTALPSGEKVRMGEVIPIQAVTQPVELVPVYGQKLDSQWTSNTSLELPTNFYLNNFDDKDFYHRILTSYL
ncbi:hypothetical protein PLICRDRAFT_117735 [Plicaturopsis crispa FD-325 SS-3]|uniref:DUF6830 domain-containing protein n=1 Tax=Plicaturopsis crispa FD-325 SS-3 TaxID=944288 RepID=A0A0C9T8G6_PLICR|nr:hypothetical protein PLICRDRAFT_117735 [Plicaturopsis crispa FD-325 SS-3]